MLTLNRYRDRNGDIYELSRDTMATLNRDHGENPQRNPRLLLGHDIYPPQDHDLSHAQRVAIINILTRLPDEVTQTYICEVRNGNAEGNDKPLIEIWWDPNQLLK